MLGLVVHDLLLEPRLRIRHELAGGAERFHDRGHVRGVVVLRASVDHVAPRLANGWAYLGELSKFVPVTEARTRSLSFDAASVAVALAGAAGEEVGVAFLAPNGTVVSAECVLSAAGLGEVIVG